MAPRTATARLLCLILAAARVTTTAWAHGGGGGDSDSDADGEKPNLRARGLVAAKLWCLAVVFVGTLAGGVSPYFMRWNEAFLALGTQFAGGVFLGTALMHFSATPTRRSGTCSRTRVSHTPSCSPARATSSPCSPTASSPTSSPAAGAAMAPALVQKEGKVSNTNGTGSGPQPAEAHNGSSSADHNVASMLRNASTLGDSVLLIAALCFHSVFEGIAIGVAETKADAWKALWTISLHKIFAAIAMGIALLRMLPNRPLLSCFAYAFAFAISSPIGVGIGIVIDATTQGRVADWIFAISMGLATGIFIYVSINHLLSKGYKPGGRLPSTRRWAGCSPSCLASRSLPSS
ncbi:hypothetical protein EJB05_06309 [Eragrostis curvula]|uniref:Zinc transporter n=1 Tax=Eragrostis curvula TaxID=38414 RepID=A0A5J9WDH5_9POAL|nr:hypothetical protein EJB05_06309 [Eragrostis curvula]